MINVPYDKEFVFHDGSRCKNILELKDKVDAMPYAEFFSFVNESKNDFANWIEYVILDKSLADKLRSLRSKEETLIVLDRKINELLARHGHHTQDTVHSNVHNTSTHINSVNSMHTRPSTVATALIENHVSSNVKYTVEPNQPVHHTVVKKIEARTEEEKRPARNWFEYFRKRQLSHKKLDKISSAEIDKHNVEHELKVQETENASENMLWVILYSVLILAIVVLLIYKFIIMK